MKYQWKDGIPSPKVEADVFGLELEKIENEKGTVKAADVVAAARDPKSPIHILFTWDDAKAAEEHRKDQARNLIGGLQVVRVRTSTNGPVSNRAFHLVKPEGDSKRGYVGRDRVVGDADLRKQVIASAKRELEGFIKKFQHIAAMGKYMPDLQTIVDSMRDDIDQIMTDATRRTAAKASADEHREGARV